MLTGQEGPPERGGRTFRFARKAARQATAGAVEAWQRRSVTAGAGRDASLIGAVVGTGVFALLGFFVAPPIARHVAQNQLGELLADARSRSTASA